MTVTFGDKYTYPGNISKVYYIAGGNELKTVTEFVAEGNGIRAILSNAKDKPWYIPSINGSSNNSNYADFLWVIDSPKGAGHITFKYYPEDQVNDTVAVEDVNTVKYTVDVVKEDGKDVTKEEKAAFLTGAQFRDITFDSDLVDVAEAFGAFEIPGLKLDGDIAYWYWNGNYQGNKRAVTTFRNFGDVSTEIPGYKSNIGFKAPTQGTGNDYSDTKFSNPEGYYAYNPTGTLRIVFKVVSESFPYSTIYKNGKETVGEFNDTVKKDDQTNYQTQYTYYPVDKLDVFTEAYMESNYPENGEFLGWSTSEDDKENFVDADFFNTAVTSDVTLYAVWMDKASVIYHSNYGTDSTYTISEVPGENGVEVLSYDATALPERNGYTFFGWALTSASDKAEYQAGDKLVLGAGDNKDLYAVWSQNTSYSVKHYTQVLKGGAKYNKKNYTLVETEEKISGVVGEEINISDIKKTYDGYVYSAAAMSVENDKFTTGVRSAFTLDADENNNTICLFYDYDVPDGSRKVAFFLLLPDKEIPKDASAQPTSDYYPVNGNDEWLGAANATVSVPVFDTTGAAVSALITECPETQIASYLAARYPGQEVTPVWYVYKNISNADYHIDGYVRGASVNVNYFANYGDYIDTFYTDTNAKTGTYTVLGYDAGTMAPLPERKGWVFTGWNTKADGTGTAYAAGESFTLMDSANLYAQWEVGVSDVTVEVYLQNNAGFMGTASGDAAYNLVDSKVIEDVTTDSEYSVVTGDSVYTEYATVNKDNYIFNADKTMPISGKVVATEDGSAVIKIYFDLKTYEVSLDLNKPGSADVSLTVSDKSDIAAYYATNNVIYDAEKNTLTYNLVTSKTFDLPEASTLGYAFQGWKDDKGWIVNKFNGVTKTIIPSIENDGNVYVAQWVKDEKTQLFIIAPGYTLSDLAAEPATGTTIKSQGTEKFTPQVGTAEISGEIPAKGYKQVYNNGNSIVEIDGKTNATNFKYAVTGSKYNTKLTGNTLYSERDGYSYTADITETTWYVIKQESDSWHIDGFANWTKGDPLDYTVNYEVYYGTEKQSGKLDKTSEKLKYTYPLTGNLTTPVFKNIDYDNYYFTGWTYESDTTLNDTFENAIAGKYMPMNSITIAAHFEPKTEITVTTEEVVRKYDGTAQGTTVTVTGLPAGYDYVATSDATATHVSEGKIEAKCDSLTITDPNGDKVVDISKYFIVNYVNGSITIKPAPITVETFSAKKVYDGTALTAGGKIEGVISTDEILVVTTGSQTKVGNSSNTYKLNYVEGTESTDYILVDEKLGTLEVTEYDGAIIATTTGGIYVYDGNAHGASVSISLDIPMAEPSDFYSARSFNDGASVLPKGYYVDVAASSAKATHVSEGVVAATADQLVIRNADDEDVTSKLVIRYVDDTIEITPAKLTVVTDSAAKAYDGTALTAKGTLSGLVAGEKVTFKLTGKQTEVGRSKNTYSITFDQSAKESDYTITDKLGLLRVYDETVPEPTPGDEPTPGEDPIPGGGAVAPVVVIPDAAAPLANPADAGVLGAVRGIEADDASVLGARRTTDDAAVLGARRDANTGDENNFALYLMLMGAAAGVGAAYVAGRKHKKNSN